MLNKKCGVVKLLVVILSMLFLLSVAGCGKLEQQNIGNGDEIKVNHSWDELGKAINEAKDGDVIYVDDIDFAPLSPDEYITNKQITIGKNITIKSGKQDGCATFLNGMFILSGSKISGEKSCVKFENIVFNGKIDTKNLNIDNLPEDGFYSHALEFLGNVDCVFKNCEFMNYYYGNGAVMEVRYGDYTAIEGNLFKDQSNCRLNLDFEKCVVSDNRAFYTGGAFLIEGNNNVTLNMTECILKDNKSGAYYGMGGGAIYADGANVNLKGCVITNNQCNYCYPQIEKHFPMMDSLSDNARGGGMLLKDCSLNMEDCVISKNVGTIGGGIALTNTKADFDGCSFLENIAQRCAALENDDTIVMPCSVGQGGALYSDGGKNLTVTLTNSYIYGNVADVAYAGIYQYYLGNIADPSGVNYLKLNCCTYANNSCKTIYDYSNSQDKLWNSLPGDIWTDLNTSASGSLIVDDTFKDLIFNKYEKPNADNSFNYFGSLQKANSDGIEITYSQENNKILVKLPQSEQWNVPNELFTEIIGDRYDGKLTSAVVGSNYKKELYYTKIDEEKANKKEWLFIGIISGIIVIGVAVTVIVWIRLRRNKKSLNNGEMDVETIIDDESVVAEDQKPPKQIIFVRFSEEQINDVMTNMAEVQLFTKREKEVFKEMLLGKKQSEIASQLYISTSTVKDFYQKIYGKMGVDNKDALFEKVLDENKK